MHKDTNVASFSSLFYSLAIEFMNPGLWSSLDVCDLCWRNLEIYLKFATSNEISSIIVFKMNISEVQGNNHSRFNALSRS